MINIMINHYLMVTFMMVIFIKRYLLVYMVLKYCKQVGFITVTVTLIQTNLFMQLTKFSVSSLHSPRIII